jgi:predicted HTH transcriptional regulator
MRRKELEKLIEEGENSFVEFKRKFSGAEKIAREMIAFANTSGGHLLLGVDDDKKIYGVESEKGEAELIKDAAMNYCEPPLDIKIDYIEMEGKEVVIVTVPESSVKPVRLQDYLPDLDILKAQVFIRVNDKSVLAAKEMVKILRAESKGIELKKYKIGSNEHQVFEYLKKYEKISVKELSKLVNISERRASRTLINMVRANLLHIHTKDNGEQFFTGRD